MALSGKRAVTGKMPVGYRFLDEVKLSSDEEGAVKWYTRRVTILSNYIAVGHWSFGLSPTANDEARCHQYHS
jgi:hypothetical protein